MSFTAISSSRCSTPITTSAASCRSTSMTRREAGPSPCCCVPARHARAPRSAITGGVHSGRPQVMEWCDENDIDFIFGLPGITVLDRLVDATADDIRTRRALDQKPCLRGFAETSYRAKSWNIDRRACARIEATTKGLDIRCVVTSIETGSAEHIYQTLYCARGQAENPGLRRG